MKFFFGALLLFSHPVQAATAEFRINVDLAEVSENLISRFQTDDAISECVFEWNRLPAAGSKFSVTVFRQDVPGAIRGRPTQKDSPLKAFSCSWVQPMEPFDVELIGWATQNSITAREIE